MTTPAATPARLTSSAAAKLPRTVLWVVGFIYIFSGLFFRDPWKSDDVIGLATMLSAMQYEGWQALIAPQIGDLAYAQTGPLHMWIGVASLQLFAPLFGFFMPEIDALIMASRLPNILYFLILISTLWQGVFRLAQSKAAQPLSLPFGGEPSPKSYGRMLADAALLLCVATVGIIWRLHESSGVPLSLALSATVLYAFSFIQQKPGRAALLLGVALGASFLNQGPWVAASLLLSLGLVMVFCASLRSALISVLGAILIAAALAASWLYAIHSYSYWWHQWWLHYSLQLHGLHYQALLKSIRDLLWFLWPTWPLALVALWQWRAWWRTTHIAIPLALLVGPLVFISLHQNAFEPEFSLLVVPSAALAAFALPTLRRAAINSLDWFAVMCFSLFAATIWLGWIAQQTGWPPKIAQSIYRQTQGFDTQITWFALLLALAGTGAWLALVLWRLRTHPPALWRGTVLSAGGLVTTWLLLVTLWLPALDYARSYRGVSQQLAHALDQLEPGQCVRAVGIGLGQRASFYAFDGLNFSFDHNCAYVLQQTSPKLSIEQQNIFSRPTTLLWQGRRGGDRNEMFRLLAIEP